MNGIQIPPVCVSDRIDNGAGDLALNLLFFSATQSLRIREWRFIGVDGFDQTFAVGQVSQRAVDLLNQGWANAFATLDESWSGINLINPQTQTQEGLKLAGFNEGQLKQIANAFKGLLSESCRAAFVAAGLKDPVDVLENGITIFKSGLLDSVIDMSKIGLNSNSTEDLAFRGSMLDAASGSLYYNDVTSDQPYKGRIFMALKQRAFNETDGPFAVTFVHAWIHAAGAPGRRTHPVTSTTESLTRTPGQRFPHPPIIRKTTTQEVPNSVGDHDLKWLNTGPNTGRYDAIIANCTKE